MLHITPLKALFLLDTLPSNAIVGFRVVILCTKSWPIFTASISITMQKYAIKKDRLVCSSCNSQIKGAAVKAGGNFWHKVFIVKWGILFVKNIGLSKKKEQNNSIFKSFLGAFLLRWLRVTYATSRIVWRKYYSVSEKWWAVLWDWLQEKFCTPVRILLRIHNEGKYES